MKYILFVTIVRTPRKKLVTNLESPELSLYAFKAVCRPILETL